MATRAIANGETWRAIQDKDLSSLLDYFGIRVPKENIGAYQDEISAKFTREAGEIVRLCARMPEREKHMLFREALRLSCESVVARGSPQGACAPRPSRGPGPSRSSPSA